MKKKDTEVNEIKSSLGRFGRATNQSGATFATKKSAVADEHSMNI
jgi:hypothetical protein